MKRLNSIQIVIAAGLLLAPVQSFALGDDDGTSTRSKPVCKKGYVYSKIKKRCVRQGSEIIPDQMLIDQGWALAYQGKFNLAVDLFNLVVDQRNPQALNGLGYSYRKMGQLDRGIGYYQQALAIDPDYHLAREYLGEGYVKAGRIGLAKAQLSEIALRCGTECKEYRLLARAIATGDENDW